VKESKGAFPGSPETPWDNPFCPAQAPQISNAEFSTPHRFLALVVMSFACGGPCPCSYASTDDSGAPTAWILLGGSNLAVLVLLNWGYEATSWSEVPIWRFLKDGFTEVRDASDCRGFVWSVSRPGHRASF